MQQILISGASLAGLATAYWLNKAGYQVTVVEIAKGLKKGGTAVDLKGNTIDVVKRMGLFERIKANRLNLMMSEFKDTNDVTCGQMVFRQEGEERPDTEMEIERDRLLDLLFDLVKSDVDFVFDTTITAMAESADAIAVTLSNGERRSFDLVFGCDGLHSVVRRLWFGHESEFVHFLGCYFSVTIVDKLLVKRDTSQLYNTPGRVVMLNAYKNKTDIVLMFASDNEIAYDYRDEQQQRKIIQQKLAGQGWRTDELLAEVANADSFYFDKLCQVRMPSWVKGRVALVGDSGYCPSPAAGMGGSLALDGAAALADAFDKHGTNFEAAFADYDKALRPFIDGVQAEAVNNCAMLMPMTEDDIRKRNSEVKAF